MNNNEELKVDEMSAEDILAEINKRKENLDKLLKEYDRNFGRKNLINENNYLIPYHKAMNMSFDSEALLKFGKFVGGAASIGTFLYEFCKRVDAKEFFIQNPDALEKAKEITGISDVKYLSRYLVGSSDAARALSDAIGYGNYYWGGVGYSILDGLAVGGSVLLPFVGYHALNRCRWNKYHKEKARTERLISQKHDLSKKCEEEKEIIKRLKEKYSERVNAKQTNDKEMEML